MDEISDEQAVSLVRSALADSKWDFRTIGGISRSTGLSNEKVVQALIAVKDEVRQSLYRSPQGEPLFTLRKRAEKLREKLAVLQQAISY